MKPPTMDEHIDENNIVGRSSSARAAKLEPRQSGEGGETGTDPGGFEGETEVRV